MQCDRLIDDCVRICHQSEPTNLQVCLHKCRGLKKNCSNIQSFFNHGDGVILNRQNEYKNSINNKQNKHTVLLIVLSVIIIGTSMVIFVLKKK